MTTQEINEILARFMGFKQGKEIPERVEDGRFLEDWFDVEININGLRNSILRFTTDWNWIMAVVEKMAKDGKTMVLQNATKVEVIAAYLANKLEYERDKTED